MCRVFTVCLVAAAALCPVTAAAQSVAESKSVTVTPFVSGTIGPSDDLGEVRGIGDLGGSLGIGVAIGYDWTPNLGFEFELGRVFDIAGDNDDIDVPMTTISGNFIYHFDVVHVTPYATAGLGWQLVGINLDDVDEDPDGENEFAWNFGGGLKIPINSRVLARADLRRFQGNDLAPDHWRLYGGVTFWIKR
jgi:opacity protein-like surface antigen